MARVAKLSGDTLSVIAVGPQVEYHVTKGENDGDLNVTPKAFGKFLNSSRIVIPALVVEGIRNLTPVTDTTTETPKGK